MSARSARTRLAAVAGAAALALAVAGCGSDSDDSGGGETVEGVELVKADKLVVCTHLSYKPFEYKDEDGEVVGMDMDMADLVADRLDVETEIVDISFDQITSGAVFAAKKCDLGMGAITITEERQEAVNFSTPYFSATQALLTKKDSGISDLSDLGGKSIGVQTDTTGQAYVEDNQGDTDYDIVVFDDLPTELTGVQSGRVDAIVNDNGPLFDWINDNPEFEVVKEFETGEEYGFVGMKDDDNATKLMDIVDEEFVKAIDDGTYAESYKEWFGTEPEVLPETGN